MCVNTSTFESAFFRLLGYLDNPEATAQTIDSKGWLHTGDIVRYDEHEYFFIVGRIKELIKYKGFQKIKTGALLFEDSRLALTRGQL